MFVKKKGSSVSPIPSTKSLVAKVADTARENMARENIERGKQSLRKWGHDKIISSAREFTYSGDSFFSYAPVAVHFCFYASPSGEVVPTVEMADFTEAGMWTSSKLMQQKNCVYVGDYPAPSVLELAPRDAKIMFIGLSAGRVGAREHEKVPLGEILEKIKGKSL